MSNLKHVRGNPGIGDNHNASVFPMVLQTRR